MHLSANEIDVSFQYRYANQVIYYPCLIPLIMSNLHLKVSQGHSRCCWWPYKCQAFGDT